MSSAPNKYWATLRLGFFDAIEYRTEFFISLVGWAVRLAISFFLWMAVAESQGGAIGGYSSQRILAYFFTVQIISSFVFSRVGFEIALDIYRGDFANFLLKPMSYLAFRLLHEVSKNIFRTILGLAIFGTVLVTKFGGIPLGLWKLPAAAATIAGAYLVNFCLVTAVALLAFWIGSATRLTFIYFGILTVFSGMLFPLDLFPARAALWLSFLPFPSIFYIPAKILLASDWQNSFGADLARQWIFAIILLALITLLYRRGVRKFEAVGR